jgi:hypothetical protein
MVRGKPCLRNSPVQVRRGAAVVGEREIAGDDLACLFAIPRAASESAMIAVVSGTGVAGLRASSQLPYFISGVAYPDCIVIGAESLEPKQPKAGIEGVRCAGFFGQDWSMSGADFVWRE